MDIAALICACIAALLFVLDAFGAVNRLRVARTSLGLAFLTVALIFQFISLTGTTVS